MCLALQELSATATTATDTANPALTAGMVTRTQNARQMTPKLAPRHHGHGNDCYNLSAQLLRQLRLGVCYRNYDHTHIGSRTVEVSRLPILRNGCLVKARSGMSAKECTPLAADMHLNYQGQVRRGLHNERSSAIQNCFTPDAR